MPKTLHLVIPGLLGPWRATREEDDFPQPRADALERLLGRAQVKNADFGGADATLFNLFHLPVTPHRDLPVAAVTWLADAAREEASGWWLRADPVHLRADLHQVLLFDARYLDISPAEAQSLVAEFNQMFHSDGWQLQAPDPGRWYLRLEADPGLRTHPVIEATGRNIDSLLPEGDASGRWHALLTEVQMLFHNATVNAIRESRGQLPINGVWFWGGGELPEGASGPWDGVYAADPLTRGLARLAGMAVSPLPGTAMEWRDAAADEVESLLVLESTYYDTQDNDSLRWCEHLEALERDWFLPCLEMLKHRVLDGLYLYPCNGWIYVVTPGDLQRFWRRIRGLAQHLVFWPG